MKVKNSNSANVLLIGAGPIGLEVAVALKKSNIDYFHVEAGSIASTISWWAPGTHIFSSPERISIAGVPFEIYPNPKATREEYLNYLRGVVKQFDLKIKLNTRVTDISQSENFGFVAEFTPSLHGVGGKEEYARSKMKLNKLQKSVKLQFEKVILAIGDMQLPNELGISGEDQENVSHFFEEPHRYFGSKVVVVGGKNSAAEAVVRLARIGCEITWCTRSASLDEKKIKPWILPEALGLIREQRVKLLTCVEPLAISDGTIKLKSPNTGTQVLNADYFLLLTGYRQDSSLFEKLGIELSGEEKRPKFNLETMETNVSGVFVAGTATAGTQRRSNDQPKSEVSIFIENCHQHSVRIVSALSGNKMVETNVQDRPLDQREQ